MYEQNKIDESNKTKKEVDGKTKEGKKDARYELEDKNRPDYCEIGMANCIVCGWRGNYPVSGCPECNKSFVD